MLLKPYFCMITFKEKEFTTKDIVDNNLGIIKEILAHILKLKYRFDYNRDEKKHKRDLVNIFLSPLLKYISKDKKSKGPDKILEYYLTYGKVDKTKKKIEDEFKKDYGFKSKISNEDFNFALDIFLNCLKINDLNRIKIYLDEKL